MLCSTQSDQVHPNHDIALTKLHAWIQKETERLKPEKDNHVTATKGGVGEKSLKQIRNNQSM